MKHTITTKTFKKIKLRHMFSREPEMPAINYNLNLYYSRIMSQKLNEEFKKEVYKKRRSRLAVIYADLKCIYSLSNEYRAFVQGLKRILSKFSNKGGNNVQI